MSFNLRRGITEDRQKEYNKGLKKPLSDVPDLNDMSVCITGTIPGYTRVKAGLTLLSKYPNIIINNTVTSTTDYLITGHGVGQTKLKAAQKYNVSLIEASTYFK
jgi:NAD-dependent DNA ligase